jgi:hypothetical protein
MRYESVTELQPIDQRGSHWAPNARDTHPGSHASCTRPECVNDREDDAQWTPPPYLSVPVPQRRDNGQRP